jgi:GntR family transcriptional regulator
MFTPLDPSDPTPIYLQIMDDVKRQVALGMLRADEPLPAVRHLASELKVNPNTVQHAYRELARDGTAYVRRGRGTFIGAAVGKSELSRQRQASIARQIARRALRDAHRNGLVASELLAALKEVAETA